MPGKDCGFLWNMPLLVYLQPTKLSDAQAIPTSWLRESTRGLQLGGHVHKEVVHLLFLEPASITSKAPLNLSVMTCHSLERTQAHSMPVREFNLTSYARLWFDWLAAVAQPKCTEVPNYPHNCHAIPIFVHHIGLPLAIH